MSTCFVNLYNSKFERERKLKKNVSGEASHFFSEFFFKLKKLSKHTRHKYVYMDRII